MKALSFERASRRSLATRDSTWTGSCWVISQRVGSTQRKRSLVRSSHDHLKLKASSCRGASGSGSRALTVKLLKAFILGQRSKIRRLWPSKEAVRPTNAPGPQVAWRV